jgi:uncharacterized GH25 family protein
MLKRTALGLALVLGLAGSALAHDLFIVPEQFRVAGGQTMTIGFHSGDGFPDSVQLPQRLQNAAIHSGKAVTPIENLRADGKRSIGTANVPGSGHVIATIIAGANTISMEPKEFEDYLKEEGLTDVIEWRSANGEAQKPARERYTKFAKALMLAGAPNDGYKQAVGLQIEFVPEKDPYAHKAGEALPVQLLVRGKGAPNLEVRVASSAVLGKVESIGRTDANGKISIPVPAAGQYRLHAIHMERVTDGSADWESFWGTLTFEVK